MFFSTLLWFFYGSTILAQLTIGSLWFDEVVDAEVLSAPGAMLREVFCEVIVILVVVCVAHEYGRVDLVNELL